jgi:flavin-dependent dehydrogenase
MEYCEVLIIGGGPAGSSCARQLRRAGLDAVVMDRAAFPRDKPCAGWITPQVIAHLDLDCEEYRRGRTFQPIRAFRTGIIGSSREIETRYGQPVSYGIRRCEFDRYLLERSGARLRLGTPVSTIRRDGAQWMVNESLAAPMLVGAGGHFCPVARRLNPTDHASWASPATPLVVAQEAEFLIPAGDIGSWRLTPGTPELYFSRDLNGYGWCFLKERYVNIGLGRLERASLPKASAAFVAFLRSRRTIPSSATWRWRGHAYLVSEPRARRTFDAGVLLAGDAAGLAYPQSGEGIGPAVESGLMAAATIIEAAGQYTRAGLNGYEERVRGRFGIGPAARLLSRTVPPRITRMLAPRVLEAPWLVRHVVLDRWFLHAA